MDPSKLSSLKVPELKKALEERGLDTKGLKAELVDRLKAALIADGSQQGDTCAPASEVPKAQGEEAPKAEPEPEPAAAEPVPTDPVPTDLAPTEPVTAEPVAAKPVAAEPVAVLAATDAPAKSEADGAPAASLVEAKVAGEPSELSPPSVAAPIELPKQVISEGAAEVEPSAAAASVTTASDVPPSAAAPEHETNKRPREDDQSAGDDSKRAKPEEGGDGAAPPPYQPPAAAEQAGYAAGAEQSYTQPGQAYADGYGQAYGAYPQQYAAYGQHAVPGYGAPQAVPGMVPGAAGGGDVQTVVIEVPNDKVGLVIGKAGCTIKELEMRSGARVQITPDVNWQGRAEPRPIQLTGTSQQLEWCKSLVSEKVNVPVEGLASTQQFVGPAAAGASAGGGASASSEAQGGGPGGSEAAAGGGGGGSGRPEPYSTEAPGGGLIVHVPNDSVGLIIGKQGATIKMLEQGSGARIQIAKECPPGTNMRPITVTGSPQCVEQGKAMIVAKVNGVDPPMPAQQAAFGGAYSAYGAPHAGYHAQGGYGYPQHGYGAGGYPQQAYYAQQQQAYYGGYAQQGYAQQQGAASGQGDYSAQWAAYYAAQAAAGGGANNATSSAQ